MGVDVHVEALGALVGQQLGLDRRGDGGVVDHLGGAAFGLGAVVGEHGGGAHAEAQGGGEQGSLERVHGVSPCERLGGWPGGLAPGGNSFPQHGP